jgi:hypothetical protein
MTLMRPARNSEFRGYHILRQPCSQMPWVILQRHPGRKTKRALRTGTVEEQFWLISD